MQKRYRDWKAPIGSKNSMEPLALTVGIGPQFGFDKVSYIATGGVGENLIQINLGNQNVDLPGVTGKDTYIATTEMSILRPHIGVTTPDGILAIMDEDVLVTVDTDTATKFSEQIEVGIIATHLYIEDDDASIAQETTFRAVVNSGIASIMDLVYPSYTDETLTETVPKLSNIYGLEMFNGIDPVSEVIVGVLVIDLSVENPADANNQKYIFYHNQWPQPVIIAKNYWDAYRFMVQDQIALLNKRVSSKKSVLYGTDMVWSAGLSSVTPDTYSFTNITLRSNGKACSLQFKSMIDKTDTTPVLFTVNVLLSTIFTLDMLDAMGMTIEEIYSELERVYTNIAGHETTTDLTNTIKVPAYMDGKVGMAWLFTSNDALVHDHAISDETPRLYIRFDFTKSITEPEPGPLDNVELCADFSFNIN